SAPHPLAAALARTTPRERTRATQRRSTLPALVAFFGAARRLVRLRPEATRAWTPRPDRPRTATARPRRAPAAEPDLLRRSRRTASVSASRPAHRSCRPG